MKKNGLCLIESILNILAGKKLVLWQLVAMKIVILLFWATIPGLEKVLVYIRADEACRALSISQLAFYCTLVISQMFIAP